MLSPSATTALAVVVLCGLLAVPILLSAVAMRQLPFSVPQAILYGLSKAVSRVLWRAKIEGSLKISPGHGAVIVCDHRGPIDPAFIQLGMHRVVHWMVAREFCESYLFGWFLKTCEVIPVGRGGVDTAATKAAIRFAEKGGLVGIFPEGRINTGSDVLMPGRPGAVMIALKARVPIVPCYLEGSPFAKQPWAVLLTPAKARLVIGEPIDLSSYYDEGEKRETLETVTKQVLKEIARLGGHPEYEPRLAGRFYAANLSNGQ